ncbi:aromatic hydrocarbon degradation protein [Aliivibrio fischeri]|uniref:Aromatic hydrocarbon degradation protein n=1 Tax=Aliivibrio fischeri TaxID=668 RepID=A0A6N3Z146_ALIFS|nr:outer membrane protein transport protein [Aliivibrio fischeri]MUJ21450.1 aromatic hydrocarbon degradation protein [Aliivibrio fischeri]MUK36895.1 aromatic hydrocarbon degradation protein [Aliivibrio fischeri]MUK46858.1 aromatic hydrocarbon degradation protein [Aliivibrio fischeri]MUK82725.1 aromatic hydrocarbon degradation protein [Aliivibrio fischeri]MUK84773.1 aromatic hydrocarbon degradation protein [Aliivibrio fischeri]
MNTTFSRTLLATSTLFISATSMAAGFQVNEHSATGLGRAFAGEAVIADNASVLSRNAAAMMMFDKDAISVGMTVVKPDVSVKNGTYYKPSGSLSVDTGMNYIPGSASLTSEVVSLDDVDGIAPTAVVPNFYYIHPVNEKFAVGVAAYSNFGTGTEFESDYAAPIFGGTTKVQSMNLGLSLAYRVNEHLSFGGGIDVIYGMGDLYRDVDGNVNVKMHTPLGDVDLINKGVKTTAVDIQATGVGLGANIGMVYEVNEGNRFGLSYKYSPEIEAEGDVSFMKQSYDAVYLPLPDIAEFSGFHMITDKTAIHYSIQWVGWSAFDTIETESATVKEYNWKDSYHYSIGATHYLNSKWILRTGYMYDQTPVDELTSISIPDSDRQWFSAGFTYNWSSNTAIDFGVTYLIGEDVEVHEFIEESLPAPAVTATTHANAVLAAIQLSHSF